MIGNFLIKSPMFNPPILFLQRYTYVYMHVIFTNILSAKTSFAIFHQILLSPMFRLIPSRVICINSSVGLTRTHK